MTKLSSFENPGEMTSYVLWVRMQINCMVQNALLTWRPYLV